MDPMETLKELRLALRRDDRQDSRYFARCLRDWLKSGGFVPGGATRKECDDAIAMALDPYGDIRDGVK